MPKCPVDNTDVALLGQFCSAVCYSEWLSVKLYEALEGPADPYTHYQATVPIKLTEGDEAPLPLMLQPWYQGFIDEV